MRSLADQLLQRFASNCFKVGFLDNYESAIPFMTAHDYDGKLLTANGHTSSAFPQPVNRMRFVSFFQHVESPFLQPIHFSLVSHSR